MYSVICFIVLLIGLLGMQTASAGGIQKPPHDNGFYLTAEVGGANFQKAHIDNASILLGTQVTSVSEIFSDNGLSVTWSAGLGWQFNSLFRIDINYLTLKFPLIIHSFGTTGGLTGSTTFLKPNSNVYLFNAYINLVRLFGHFSRFSPYFGAGLGYARNSMQEVFSTSNIAPHFPIFADPAKRTDFAYRLMLGFTFPLTSSLRMFAQYSFICAGKYALGRAFSSPAGNGLITAPIEFHIHVSTYSAGLAYLFR